MTDNKEIKYLDMELMEKMCHKLAVAIFDTREDPIARFHEHNDLLDSALNLPRHDSGYPTLIDKAAILYYVLNKNHPFRNGNKRIAATSLLVFLLINGHWLSVANEALYEKTLYVAKSDRTEKDKIVAELKQWIKNNLVTEEYMDNIKK
jgi:death-on-curing protein